ncbi:unnamed protein product [Laminaria digitata]
MECSGSELARMIRAKQISSAEVVQAHIDFAKRINPYLNAIVRDRFDEAMREAERADRDLETKPPEEIPPFHGVPCTIKESFSLEKMPNSAGLVARRHIIAHEDAVAVARVRRAGVIPIGVTNVPELCMWYETHNYVYGRTNNAYSQDHICGGSSGGEGAIIGAGASPLGLGSDIGGSIRMPAFFNGVFGHKPTGGLIPSTGQFPRSEGAASRYYATGPICRRAEDLEPLTRIMSGPDGRDLSCREDISVRETPARIEDVRVYVIDTNGFIEPTPEIKDGVRRAAHALKQRGCRVERVEIADLEHSFEIWSAMLGSSDGPTFSQLLGQGEEIDVMRELMRWATRTSPHTLPALALALTEKITKYATSRVAQMIQKGNRMREEMVDLLGEDAVLLYPPFPEVAPRHLHPLYKPAHFVYTGIFNVMEVPVSQVPLGLSEEGLPLGVQVAASHGQDHLCLTVARELETLFGGWVPPWRAGEERER